jgi:hypothetical protein
MHQEEAAAARTTTISNQNVRRIGGDRPTTNPLSLQDVGDTDPLTDETDQVGISPFAFTAIERPRAPDEVGVLRHDFFGEVLVFM